LINRSIGITTARTKFLLRDTLMKLIKAEKVPYAELVKEA
jgi:hypothetical protein